MIAVAVVAAACSLTGCGSIFYANGYVDQVAAALKESPVFVDDSAFPAVTDDEQAELAKQIRVTHKPIFIVMVDDAKAAKFGSVSQFINSVADSMGVDSAVFGYSFSMQYVPVATGDAISMIGDLETVTKAASDQGGATHRFDEALSAWVTSVSTLNWPPSVADWQPPAPEPTSWTWLYVTLSVLVVLGVAVVIIWRRKHRPQPAPASRRTNGRARRPEAAGRRH
jgi:hypothetical protein